MRAFLNRTSVWFLRLNVALLVLAIIGWPVTQLTIARHEPPFVLGLSWLAIIMAAWGNLLTAAVKDDTSGPGGE
jgi:hypothetical protein